MLVLLFKNVSLGKKCENKNILSKYCELKIYLKKVVEITILTNDNNITSTLFKLLLMSTAIFYIMNSEIVCNVTFIYKAIE